MRLKYVAMHDAWHLSGYICRWQVRRKAYLAGDAWRMNSVFNSANAIWFVWELSIMGV